VVLLERCNMAAAEINITPTSSNSASVHPPVIVRQGEQRRLIFRPEVVKRPEDDHALIRGSLRYQVKKKREEWGEEKARSLASIKAGEEYCLSLNSTEMLRLFEALSALYEHAHEFGVPANRRRLMVINKANENPEEMREVLDWLQSRDALALAKTLSSSGDPALVQRLYATVSLARLDSFIARARDNFSNDDEEFWQQEFMANDWVLAQLFSQPIVVVAQKSYVGGKRFDSKGGNYIDYLCRNELTSSAILVEIKTPETPLVDRTTYRENTHPAARNLAGGVQQLLQDSHSIARYADQLMRGSDAPRVDVPKLLLIAGLTSKLDENMMRSFELFRSCVFPLKF
jgi:hypothetical protein